MEKLKPYPSCGNKNDGGEDVPTIDPVHAAGGCYCRECKHKDTNVCPAYDAPMWRTSLRIEFCSYGERRTEHENNI